MMWGMIWRHHLCEALDAQERDVDSHVAHIQMRVEVGGGFD
jgi:hypothetical protein